MKHYLLSTWLIAFWGFAGASESKGIGSSLRGGGGEGGGEQEGGKMRELQGGCSSTRCGTSWSDANGKCGTTCAAWPNDGWDACPSGESCFANMDTSLSCCSNSGAGDLPTTGGCSSIRCGTSWSDASSKCGTTCAAWPDDGWDACPLGENCYANMPTTLDCCTSSSIGSNCYQPPSMILPQGPPAGKVVGGYVPADWNIESTPRITSFHADYNVIYIAFGRPVGGGPSMEFTFRLDSYPGGENQFYQDIQTVRGSGTRVILSVGGQNGGFILDTTAEADQFVTSVKSLFSQFGGFDGIDFNNFENRDMNNAEINTLVYASQQLKHSCNGFGSNFLITGAPSKGRLADEQWAISMKNANVLDWVGLQFYDGNTDNYRILDRLAGTYFATTPAWVPSLGEDLVVIGLGVRENCAGQLVESDYWTSVGGRAEMVNILNEYPGIRGAFQWEATWDYNNCAGFATRVGGLLAGL